jgi:hypothetical protein
MYFFQSNPLKYLHHAEPLSRGEIHSEFCIFSVCLKSLRDKTLPGKIESFSPEDVAAASLRVVFHRSR